MFNFIYDTQSIARPTRRELQYIQRMKVGTVLSEFTKYIFVIFLVELDPLPYAPGTEERWRTNKGGRQR